MDMQKLNKLCFTVCIVTIALATLLSFLLIWGPDDNKEFIWKGESSLAVLFVAAFMTMRVNKYLGKKGGGER